MSLEESPKAAPAAETSAPDDDLPIPIWRPRQPRETVQAAAARAEDEETAEGAEEAFAVPEETESEEPRRGRRRRGRRGRRPDDEAESPAEVADPEAEAVDEAPPVAPVVEATRRREAPRPPVKPAIPVPADAPQVVLREGLPTLVRQSRVYPPVTFFGSPSDERRAETVLEEMRMARESGIHLHSYLVDLEVAFDAVDDAVALAAYMLTKSVEVDPEAQVVLRVIFSAPNNWQDKYPASAYRTRDGSMSEPSVCDDAFWHDAEECLRRFVRKLRLLDNRDHILGLHLERGEWFLSSGDGYDTSAAARTKFREWARTRYSDDEVALRASWFDGGARFDNLEIPRYQPEGAEGEKFVRSSRKQRRYVDYHLFLSDATVGRLGDLAYAAKEASEGYFLIGCSYGYTFEWSHPHSGHLSLGKLLRTPEIDFIAGPPSYRSREPGGAAPFPGPIDSFALNGKLFLSEEDFKTSLSKGHEPDDYNPVIKTPQALESVHWRGAGAALAHGSGVSWMDLWGNGWLSTASIWERGSRVREALTQRMGAPLADPEVAIFVDERALAYLVDPNAFTLLVQSVRESALRAGISVGFYLLSDLAHRERFPESKLYLFLNAWDIRPELRAAIKSRLQRENKVLFWLYSAGLFDAGRESLERAREVTGIALKPQPFYSRPGTTILNRRHPLAEVFSDRTLIGNKGLEPSYFAIPENALVLGEYSQTGLPSFVVRDFDGDGDPSMRWTSVFLGEPVVSPALIRALAGMAGAHVWNFHEDVVHVRPPFCTVHCAGAGPRTLTLPDKWSAYNLLTREWAAEETPNLRFTAVDGSTHVFLVGLRTEIESLLEQDPQDLLRMEELPPREVNVRHDASNFDVPVMKLGDWIEGSDSDETSDDWFLRSQNTLEEEPGSSEEDDADKDGRRRRRRRGRGGRDRDNNDRAPAERAATTQHFQAPDDDLGMSVMFRKRE